MANLATINNNLLADSGIDPLSVVLGSGTANQIAYWIDADNIGALTTATYPSLTELSYVKGVTSAIQTQLNDKQATLTLTTTGTSGAATLVGATLNIPQYQSVLTNPVTGTGSAGQVSFWSSASAITGSNNLFWDSTNNRLGILTNSPTYNLQVNGTFYVNNNGNTNQAFYVDIGNPPDTITIFEHTGAAGPVPFRMVKNGVGGASTTYGILELTYKDNTVNSGSNLYFELTNAAGNYIEYAGLGGRIVANTNGAESGDMYFYTRDAGSGRSTKLLLKYNGNFLVGTTTDSGYKLDVNGTARFSNDVTISNGGDLIIKPATSGIDAVLYNDIGVLVSTAPISIQGAGSASTTKTLLSLTTDGTQPASTLGYDIQFYFRNTTGYSSSVIRGIDYGYSTTYRTGLSFLTTNNGAGTPSEKMSINQLGAIRFNSYGSGTITGTRAYDLAVDSSGNIIEVAVGAGTVTGSGSSAQVAYWSSASSISGENNLWWDFTNNRLGINNNGPSFALDITGGDDTNSFRVYGAEATAGPGIRIHYGGTGGKSWNLISNGTGNADGLGMLQFWNNTDSFTAMTLGYAGGVRTNLYTPLYVSGNISIGTNNATKQLTIYNSSSARLNFNTSTTGEGAAEGTEVGIFATTNHAFIWNYENADFYIGTNNTEKFRVYSAGNVLINAEAGSVHKAIELTPAGGDTTALKAGKARFGTIDGATVADVLNNSWWDGGAWNADDNTKTALLYRGDIATSVGASYWVWYSAPAATNPTFVQRMFLSGDGNLLVSGNVTGSSIIKLGGTSSQYLMADGSTSTLTNPVTGTGTATRVAFWSSSSAISSSNNLYWDNTNNRLGINNNGPSFSLDVTGGNDTNSFRVYGAEASAGPGIRIQYGGTGGKAWNLISNGTDNAGGLGRFQFWNSTDSFTALTIGHLSTDKTYLYTPFELNQSGSTANDNFYVNLGNPTGCTTIFDHTGGNGPVPFRIQKSGVPDSVTTTYGILRLTMVNKNVNSGANLFFELTNSADAYTEYAGLGGRIVSATAGAESGDMYFYTMDAGSSRSTKLLLKYNGNFLVGTITDSGYKLDVNGTGRFSNDVTISNGGDLIIKPATSGVDAVLYNDIGVLVSTASISVQGTGVFSSSVTAGQGYFTHVDTPIKLNNSGGTYTQLDFLNNGTQKAAIWWNNTTNTFNLYSGVTALSISSTGAATFSSTLQTGGNVKIVAGNGNQLDLDNTAQRYTQLNFYNNSTFKSAIWWDNTNSKLELYSGVTALSIGTTGNVEISTGWLGFSTWTAGTINKIRGWSGNDDKSIQWNYNNSPAGTLITDNNSILLRANSKDAIYVGSDGYVGINNNGASYRLDVVGDTDNNTFRVYGTNANYGPGVTIQYGGTSGRRWSIISNGAGNAGGVGALQFWNGTNSITSMLLFPNGNVGIGSNTDPGYKLGVTGTFTVNGNGLTSQVFYVDAGNSGSTQTIFEHTGSTTPVPFRIMKSGYSGAGTTFGILEIAMNDNTVDNGANLHFQLKNAAGNFVEYAGLGGRIVSNSNAAERGDLYFYTTDTGATRSTKMLLKWNGNLNVGYTSDQGYKLAVNGSVLASSYFESSDIRLKTIINRHQSVDFDAIEYKWNDGRDSKLHWGYAAQEVMKWLPDAVSGSEELFYTLDYNQVHTYKIAMLEKRIAELEQQLKNK